MSDECKDDPRCEAEGDEQAFDPACPGCCARMGFLSACEQLGLDEDEALDLYEEWREEMEQERAN